MHFLEAGCSTLSSTRGLPATSVQISSAKSSEAKDGLETELIDVDEPDDDKVKKHITKLVYQVLEPLTLTYRAVVAAIQHRTATPTPIPYPYGLAAYKFVLKPPALNVSEEAVEEFKTKFLDTFATGTSPQHREAAVAFFERANVQTSSVNRSHVHAEASLMGVACASLSKGGSRPENSPALEQVAKLLSVGVNKRCCFCCSMLADFLAKQSGDTVYPTFTFHSTFDLPEPGGIHTTIQPWAAPHIGIPLDALREMRTQLLEILYCAAFPGLSLTDTDSLVDAPDHPLTADGMAEQDLQIAAMLQRSNLED
ncbi:hypothetical protein C2E23DRAFT_72485 [Lenzites betulinus]|nr:hypothetical protein C2E23DRAFT_72485 [Lenzites betulinus]